jgi:hypothetical protein
VRTKWYRRAFGRPPIWYTHAVNTTSDLALLSGIGAQVDDLAGRVTEMAERYGTTPDSAVATELFGSERALLSARRSLDRAATFLEEMSNS